MVRGLGMQVISENLDDNQEVNAAKQAYDIRVQEFEMARIAMEKAQDDLGNVAAKALTEKSLDVNNGDVIYLPNLNLTFCSCDNKIIYISHNPLNKSEE